MSAFIVDQESIDYILSHLQENKTYFPRFIDFIFAGLVNVRNRPITFQEKLTTIKEILFLENLKSVHYRYEGRHFDYTEKPLPFKKVHDTELFQALKSLDCLEYQSCEHPDFKESYANKLINFIRKALINSDKRYEEAEWN